MKRRGGERLCLPQHRESGWGESARVFTPVTQLSPFSPPRALLTPAPGVFPQPPPPTPTPAAGQDSGGLPRAPRNAGLAGSDPAARSRGSGSQRRPREGGGAHGAWPGRGQSAREAAAGPRLVGPAGSNLPGLSRCFEPLHPLAALRLLQPPGPRTRPGCASDRREAKTQVPPVAHPRAMCARRECGFSRRFSHGRY